MKLVFQLKDEVAEDTGEHGEIKASNVIAFGETQRLPDDVAPDDDHDSRKAGD